MLSTINVSAQGTAVPPESDSYNLVELKVEHLPDLNIARSGHVTFCVDDALVVLGGHAEGFIPTATAEYLRDGVWHTVPLAYPHDQGIALKLRSGKIFLAGGHKDDLGIGQLYSAELYDPTTHTSEGFGCMDKKRAFANAIEMADGQVVISGNWYADDGIEMFENVYDPMITNAVCVKETSVARFIPYILKISEEDAIIFSSIDNIGDSIDSSIVDRLKGASYNEPFLGAWQPLPTRAIQRSYNQFIGNEAEGRYEWLLPVENSSTGEVAIARVKGPDKEGDLPSFSLLHTNQPLPDSINGKGITYSSLICDNNRRIAYLIGDNDEARIFVVAIPYDNQDSSPLTIYYTEPQPIIAQSVSPVLTKEGDLVFAGGRLFSNFYGSNAVIKLPVGSSNSLGSSAANTTHKGLSNKLWLWIIILGLFVCLIVFAFIVKRKRAPVVEVVNTDNCITNHQEDADDTDEAMIIEDVIDMIECEQTDEPISEVEVDEDIQLDKDAQKEDSLADLYKRIENLMDEEKIFLNPNLRASDVATRLSSNISYISAAINTHRGCSFSQFLTSYRVSYAQELMRENPERKLSNVIHSSGFTTESTFFRAFRSVTGMSPKEWLEATKDNEKP